MSATLRLNKDRRQRLLNHAQKVIFFPEEDAEEKRTYGILRKCIIAEVLNFATVKEMKVLRKFKATKKVATAHIHRRKGGYRRVLLGPDNSSESSWGAPTIPEKYLVEAPRVFCGNYNVDFHGDVADQLRPLLTEWEKASKAHEAKRQEALRDLRGLFRDSRTLQEVTKLWAPAADIAESLGYVPVAGNETHKRIKGLKTR